MGRHVSTSVHQENSRVCGFTVSKLSKESCIRWTQAVLLTLPLPHHSHFLNFAVSLRQAGTKALSPVHTQQPQSQGSI